MSQDVPGRNEVFARNPPKSLDILQKACVGVAGCGGLGSNAAVALARSGVGRIVIVDFDIIEASNLNRQQYFMDQVGTPKVLALRDNIARMVPGLEIIAVKDRLTAENIPEIFADCHVVVEALDRADQKKLLIETLLAMCPEKHVVAASGLAGIGATNDLGVQRFGRLHMVGDGRTEATEETGLIAPRVAVAANMQANVAVEIIIKEAENGRGGDGGC